MKTPKQWMDEFDPAWGDELNQPTELSEERVRMIQCDALRAVAQPEPKPRYHTTASTEMDPHPGFSSSPQPEPKRFPAEQGTGTVPEEVRRAVEKALESYMEGPDYTKAATDAVMQAIAPFLAGGEDKARLDWLEGLFRECPHAEIHFNDDSDQEPWPVGYTIFVDGCDPIEVTAPTLRAAIDAARAATTPSEGREK